MRLVRLAILEMGPAPDRWDCWEVSIGEVDISTIYVLDDPVRSDNKQRVLIKAEIHLHKYPDMDMQDRLIVPIREREICEAAIEDVANLISLLGKCARAIYSPAACVAFRSDDATEAQFLENSKGILVHAFNHPSHHYQLDSSLETLFSFSDRMDGVALMSDAYSTSDQSQRYRNLLRLFEIAFGLSFFELQKKLVRFLLPIYGYDARELNYWTDLRKSASYADQRKSQGITLDCDFRRCILRLEQAALDVLFNKSSWNDSSVSRRDNWMPPAITHNATGDFSLLEKTANIKVIMKFYDDFGIFPKDASIRYSGDGQKGWYMKSVCELPNQS